MKNIEVGKTYIGTLKNGSIITRTILNIETDKCNDIIYTYKTNRKGCQGQIFHCCKSTMNKWIIREAEYTNFSLFQNCSMIDLARFLVSLECKNCNMVSNLKCKERCFTEKMKWLKEKIDKPFLSSRN